MIKTVKEFFGSKDALIPKAAEINKELETIMIRNSLSELYEEQQNNNISILWKLAGVLYKGSISGVAYTAIIEPDNNDNKLFVSCAGNPPRYGWNYNQGNQESQEIKSIIEQALKYLNGEIDQFEIYKTLAILGNGLVIQAAFKEHKNLLQLSKNTKNAEEREKLKNQAKMFATVKDQAYQVDNRLSEDHFNQIPEGFEAIATKIIQKIFQGVTINDIQYAADKTIEIVPFKDEYYGIHVEAKGISYLREIYPNQEKFTVGLTTINENRFELAQSKFLEEAACCTGCSVEFKSLETVKSFEIFRMADYENKFPPSKDYKPSANVTNDEPVLIKYKKGIVEAISINEELLTTLQNQGYRDLLEVAGDTETY